MNKFNYDKKSADIIISTMEGIPVIRECDEGPRSGNSPRLYFRGKDVGCNDDGIYVEITESGMILTMRGLEIPFSAFPFWQEWRLTRFFSAKQKEFRRSVEEFQNRYQQERRMESLNTTLKELVKHGS